VTCTENRLTSVSTGKAEGAGGDGGTQGLPRIVVVTQGYRLRFHCIHHRRKSRLWKTTRASSPTPKLVHPPKGKERRIATHELPRRRGTAGRRARLLYGQRAVNAVRGSTTTHATQSRHFRPICYRSKRYTRKHGAFERAPR
jgi:hypothetical protein